MWIVVIITNKIILLYKIIVVVVSMLVVIIIILLLFLLVSIVIFLYFFSFLLLTGSIRIVGRRNVNNFFNYQAIVLSFLMVMAIIISNFLENCIELFGVYLTASFCRTCPLGELLLEIGANTLTKLKKGIICRKFVQRFLSKIGTI